MFSYAPIQPDRTPQTFWESPLFFIARYLYALSTHGYSNPPYTSQDRADAIRVVAISDTHNAHDQIPPLPLGDILVHAGDLTNGGSYPELDAALAWLAAQPHTHKVVIGGNHDGMLMDPRVQEHFGQKYPALRILQDEAVVLDVRGRRIRVYGNAQTPAFGAKAFTYPRIAPSLPYLASLDGDGVWAHVPAHTDVLVTHCPARHHVDSGGKGCAGLLCALWCVRPLLHLCGHIHTGRGAERVFWTRAQAAYERLGDGVGGWCDLGVLLGAVLKRIWSGEGARGRGRGTIVANVASKTRTVDKVFRGAEVIDI